MTEERVDAFDASAYLRTGLKVCEMGGRKIKAEWVFESLTVQSLTRRQICMCHFFAIWQVKPPYFFKGVSGRGLFFCFFLILFVVIHNLNVFFYVI